MKTLGWEFTLLCALPRMRWRSFEYVEDSSITTILEISLMYMLSHRSTLYWSVAMLFCHIVAPLCILSWLRLNHVMEVWIHIVYLVAISLVSTFMDPQCIGRRPCFESVYPSMGMPTSRMIYVYCLMFSCSFHPNFLFQFLDAHIFVKCFSHQLLF
jgi:hypothetical protein